MATRPIASNGLGLTVPECLVQLARIKRFFRLLPDRPAILSEWESLVVTHACSGRVSSDARLVAAMRPHGVTRILSFNGADFVRFPGIVVLDPATVAGSGPPLP